MKKTASVSSKSKIINSNIATPIPLIISPGKVLRGDNILVNSGAEIVRLGNRPLVVGGDRSLAAVESYLQPIVKQHQLQAELASYLPDCAESSLTTLREMAVKHEANLIIGVGGGKALDTAKLLAHQFQVPVVTVPTSAAKKK